ncbi:dihydrofolate reductase family protein [Amycolatopsis minnesotensis]|uniref:Riboflavin biosynthesis protein RibD n=1 Tax=Amycolatopsis minnesotensis TaxID=337894 RepID=A0ABP5DNB2_9PSEU
MDRPYVVLSAAVSLDGFLDDASGQRLLLSNEEDFDRVDEVRAGVDAILVGAGTIRADDPGLLVRSAERRGSRVARGLAESPVKVTLTTSGHLDPEAAFFTAGAGEKLVYASESAMVDGLNATVVKGLDLPGALADLKGRGVERLLVEGGGEVHTEFLTGGLADELHLAVAPVFVGDESAPRFLRPGRFPGGRAKLVETRALGDVVLMRYLLAEQDERDLVRLRQAIDLAENCPPSATFRVGAVVTDADDTVLATGFSGETDPRDHAEEAALAKIDPQDPRLAHATIYSSLEPCGERASRPLTCTEHILRAGIPRVVFAWREPSIFVEGTGAELLAEAGRAVVEIPALAPFVQRTNAHLR